MMTNSHRPRVLNKKRDRITAGAVYIGRPSKWGNPFQIGRDGDRNAVIAKHREWLKSQPLLLRSAGELRGRDLVCFCAPLACHGHTLLWLGRNRFARPLSALRTWPRWPTPPRANERFRGGGRFDAGAHRPAPHSGHL